MEEPAPLRLLAMRLRRERQGAGLDRGTAAWLRRRVDLSGPVHEIPREEVEAALRGGIFEVDVDATRLWWHERG